MNQTKLKNEEKTTQYKELSAWAELSIGFLLVIIITTMQQFVDTLPIMGNESIGLFDIGGIVDVLFCAAFVISVLLNIRSYRLHKAEKQKETPHEPDKAEK